MANKQISDLSALTGGIETTTNILVETTSGIETGKAAMSELITFLESQLEDTTNPANIDSALDNSTLHTDIRDIVGTSSSPTKSLANLSAHIAGTADKHDAEDITYGATTVDAYLDSLTSLLDNSLSSDLTRIVYNIETLDKSSAKEYHDGTNVVLSEELLLDSVGIDNSNFTGFNYAISHNATVTVYIMTKESDYMENLLLSSTDVKITWTEDYGRIHLSSVTINDTNMSTSDDVKIIIDAKVSKIYLTSIT